jgi:hypothetical protein
MTTACVDCGFRFETGDDGQRILSPAFEFGRLTRFSEVRNIPGGPPDVTPDPFFILSYDNSTTVFRKEAACDDSFHVFGDDGGFMIDVDGFFHVEASLEGEFGTNCTPDVGRKYGLRLDLTRNGDRIILAGDIKERQSCLENVYNLSIDFQFQAGDVIQTVYVANQLAVAREASVLSGSRFNFFTLRLLYRT